MPTRRDVLRRLGAAAVPLAGAATVGVGRSGATVAELESETPEYVSREFDEALLSRWQPRLRISHLDIQPHTTYAYVTRSQEQETVALSYWHTYRGQNGVVGSDSHFGDNEPVVVYINESTDELVSIAYSAYHWFAGRTSEPPTDGDGRPQLYAVKPWHNHTVTTEQGQLVDLEHLSDDRLSDRIRNDWPIHVPAIARPWVMRRRTDWWADDTVGPLAIERILRRAYLAAGLFGADQVDERNLAT